MPLTASRNLVAQAYTVLRRVWLSLAVVAMLSSSAFGAEVSLPSVQLPAVDATWTEFLQAAPGSEAQERLFGQFQEQSAEIGVLDLEVHALALLLEGVAAQRAGDSGQRAQALAYAERLAPELPQVAFFSSYAARADAPWRVDRVLSNALSGFSRMSASGVGRASLSAYGVRAALLIGALFSLIFVASLVVRHGSRVAHDLRLLLRRGPALSHASAFVALSVLAPALLWWSPVLAVTIGLAMVSAYLSVKERVVAVLVLGFALAVPALSQRVGALTAQSLGDRDDYSSATIARCGGQCVAGLEAAIAQGDERARVARAWVHYKAGTSDQHRRALALLDEAPLSPEVQASAELLRGNVRFVADDLAGAEAHYEASREGARSNAQRAAALVNLYRVELARGHQGTAQQVAAEAERVDRAYARRFLGYRGSSQNRLLAVSPLAPLEGGRAGDGLLSQALAERALAPWLGGVSVRVSYGLSGLALLLVLAGGLAQRRRLVSRRCARCATPVSRFVLAPAFEAGLCVLCFQLEVARDRLREPQVEARERRVSDWHEAAPRLVRIANAAAPGAGLLSAGWTFVGALLLGMFCTGLALLLVPGPAVGLAQSIRPELSYDGTHWLGGGCLAFAYVLSLSLSGRAGSAEAPSAPPPEEPEAARAKPRAAAASQRRAPAAERRAGGAS